MQLLPLNCTRLRTPPRSGTTRVPMWRLAHLGGWISWTPLSRSWTSELFPPKNLITLLYSQRKGSGCACQLGFLRNYWELVSLHSFGSARIRPFKEALVKRLLCQQLQVPWSPSFSLAAERWEMIISQPDGWVFLSIWLSFLHPNCQSPCFHPQAVPLAYASAPSLALKSLITPHPGQKYLAQRPSWQHFHWIFRTIRSMLSTLQPPSSRRGNGNDVPKGNKISKTSWANHTSANLYL